MLWMQGWSRSHNEGEASGLSGGNCEEHKFIVCQVAIGGRQYRTCGGGVIPSGASGFSAVSARSGASAQSGWSGQSGSKLVSGQSGISGWSYQSAVSGISGQSGTSGPSPDATPSPTASPSQPSPESGWSGQSGISGVSGFFSGQSGFSGKSACRPSPCPPSPSPPSPSTASPCPPSGGGGSASYGCTLECNYREVGYPSTDCTGDPEYGEVCCVCAWYESQCWTPGILGAGTSDQYSGNYGPCEDAGAC